MAEGAGFDPGSLMTKEEPAKEAELGVWWGWENPSLGQEERLGKGMELKSGVQHEVCRSPVTGGNLPPGASL